MSEIIIYPLQPKQKVFSKSTAKFRLFGGAKGGGKSYAIRSECVKQCNSAKNIRGLALRRTSPEIEENMVTPMRKELPKEFYQYNGSKNIMTFDNGSTLRFSYCRNLADVLNYQGVEYDFIAIEELTHWSEEEFKILMTSLRTARKGIIPNFFASTNPGGIGHAWVKRLWIDRNFREGEDPSDYDFIPARVYDNLVLMETMPEYIKALEALPELDRRAYLEGDWDVFKGQYFKEFRRDIHVIEPIIPRNGKRRIIALDYGYSAPSAVYWLGQDNQGNVICYRELYQTELTYKQLAIKIKAMTPEDEKISLTLVDPSIVNKRSETTGTSGSDEMKKVGMKIRGADNARVKGWTVMRQFLQPFQDPNSGELTAKLKITSNCENLIRTIPLMVHDQTNVEDINTKTEDHAVDGLRYGLVELGFNLNTMSDMKKANEKMLKRNLTTKSKEFWEKPMKSSFLDSNF